MLSSMSIACEHCGYENSDHYRFCGMCGALLPGPKAVAAETSVAGRRTATAAPHSGESQPRGVAPVSGPSFLGLSEQPDRPVDYLLEDEPRPGHGRMYVALLLLVVAGAVLAWHWRRSGYPWSESNPQVASGPPVGSRPSLSNGPPVGASASTAGPAPSAPLASSTETASNSEAPPAASPDESHMVTSDETSAHASGKAAEQPADATEAETPAGARATPEQPAEADSSKKAESAKGSEAAAANPAEGENPSGAKENSAENEAAPTRTAATAPGKKSESGLTQPSAANSRDDTLVAAGEKYLYGNGAPENCFLAQKNLRTAANHSSAKAQGILGTMYATGHCVTRDLPTAYHWFARALHNDPGNGRIERDLEVLWRQMTADERQAALRMQ
jgi:hypothetical protein